MAAEKSTWTAIQVVKAVVLVANGLRPNRSDFSTNAVRRK